LTRSFHCGFFLFPGIGGHGKRLYCVGPFFMLRFTAEILKPTSKTMKKILAFLFALACLCFVNTDASAQLITTTVSTDTLSGTDEAFISFGTVADGIKSIQATANRLSGTAAGKVYLQVTNDRTNWVTIDSSAAFSNAAVNTHIFSVTGNGQYLQYRLRFTSSGTVTMQAVGTMLRRRL
jgi:cyclophilin family peptidyl-prolyl cis-trans isomerase